MNVKVHPPFCFPITDSLKKTARQCMGSKDLKDEKMRIINCCNQVLNLQVLPLLLNSEKSVQVSDTTMLRKYLKPVIKPF